MTPRTSAGSTVSSTKWPRAVASAAWAFLFCRRGLATARVYSARGGGYATAAAAARRLVPARAARPALAAHARPLRGLDLRDHAAADPGRDRDPVLPALP